MERLLHDFVFIASGLSLTLKVTLAAICISTILGTVLAVLRYMQKFSFLIDAFVSIIRGTPLLVQLSLVYFSVPQLLSVHLSILAASVITFGLNSSAYTAEILRAGLKSVPLGQFEAAKSLHIPPFFMWRDIILPQVISNVFPTLIHEVIALIKETAIISMIGGLEVTRRAQVVAAEEFTYFVPLCMAGLIYYLIILGLEVISRRVERKF